MTIGANGFQNDPVAEARRKVEAAEENLRLVNLDYDAAVADQLQWMQQIKTAGFMA